MVVETMLVRCHVGCVTCSIDIRSGSLLDPRRNLRSIRDARVRDQVVDDCVDG
jgi:hypothetical protein